MSQATATTSGSDLAATNRELARKVLTLLGSEEQFDYFADDVVIEFPYGPSLGQAARFDGKRAVVDYSRQLCGMPRLTSDLSGSPRRTLSRAPAAEP
jgi:hypothetical protein